jgi:hypothetical protein
MSAVRVPPHPRRTEAASAVSVDEVMAPIYIASCRRFISPDKSPPSADRRASSPGRDVRFSHQRSALRAEIRARARLRLRREVG